MSAKVVFVTVFMLFLNNLFDSQIFEAEHFRFVVSLYDSKWKKNVWKVGKKFADAYIIYAKNMTDLW